MLTTQDSVSTFSLDTDRTSFQLALNWARSGYDVDPDSVRSEEWVNAFNYGYKQPRREDSFAVHTDIMPHPLDSEILLARIGFQAPHLRDDGRPLNVTLVLDSSGSMREGNRVDIAHAAADRYSSLPYPDAPYDVQYDLSVLQDELWQMEEHLGGLASYQDFSFVLDQLAHVDAKLPSSGYSR